MYRIHRFCSHFTLHILTEGLDTTSATAEKLWVNCTKPGDKNRIARKSIKVSETYNLWSKFGFYTWQQAGLLTSAQLG